MKTHAFRIRAEWLRIAVIWILFGFGYASQTYIEMRYRGMDHSYWRMVGWGLEIGMFWALLTPVILWLTSRFPLERPRLFGSLLVHVPVYFVVSLVGAANHVGSAMIINPFAPMALPPSFVDNYINHLRSYFPLSLFIYGSIVAAGHALEYRRRVHERELQTSQLETLLAQAQVLSLKTQLNPHFLFNTLNGIVALVREGENNSAVNMLIGLSSLLRYALDTSTSQIVPLSEEIEFLKQYLEIEQMRFPDRLKVNFEVEPESLDASVPAMLLQPLAENAVRHGIAPRLAPGHIWVSCRRTGADLILAVSDDGVGLDSALSPERKGIGLSNTQERLRRLYGDGQELSIVARSGGGVEARIRIPFVRAVLAEAVTA